MFLRNGCVWLVMLCSVATAAMAQDTPSKTLTIEADEWCPINCAPGSGQEGVGIELARKIFEPLGYKVNYSIVPWTQALSDVRSGHVDAAVGAGPQDDSTLMFPSNAILNITDDFYVLNGNPWRYQGPYTLKDKRIGVITAYGYGPVVEQFISENKSRANVIYEASGNDALSDNIAKLRAGKIDILIESKPVMDYTLRKKGAEGQISWAGGIAQSPVYLAFSPGGSNSRFFSTQYDAGIKRLKASGELDTIYRNYALQP